MREVTCKATWPQFLPASSCLFFIFFFFFKVIYIFYIIKIKGNKLSSNYGLHVINCSEMSSIGWKIKWNTGGIHIDVAGLSFKKWNLGWGRPYKHVPHRSCTIACWPLYYLSLHWFPSFSYVLSIQTCIRSMKNTPPRLQFEDFNIIYLQSLNYVRKHDWEHPIIKDNSLTIVIHQLTLKNSSSKFYPNKS